MNKIKINFFTIADYEEEEIWLREQSNLGLHLVRVIVPCFYVFEKSEPEDIVYRLDYKNGNQNKDYLQMFSDYGWNYFTNCFGWMYFRKPASKIQTVNDGEIFSDDESRIEMIHHIVKTRMIPVLIIFLLCVLPYWIRAISGTVTFPNLIFTIIFSILTFLDLSIIIHCGIKLKKLRQKYNCK